MSEINVKKPLRRFWKLLALERKEIISIYFFATLNGIINLSLPLGIQSIINQLFGGILSTTLIILILVVVLGVVLSGWLSILQMKVNESIQRKTFTRFSLQIAYKTPRLDLMGVDDYHLPELINRFFDTSDLQKGLSKVLLDFPSASIQILFSTILLSFYHPVFILLGVTLVGLMYIILSITYKNGMTTSLIESNYKYEVGGWLQEVARTIKTLKFMGMNDFPVRKTDELVSNYLDARKEHFKLIKNQYWAFVFFKVIITSALLIVGAVLVIDQEINIGQFIASEIVIILLLNSTEKIIASMDVVYDMLTSLEKVNKILDKPEEQENGLDILEVDDAAGISIEVENLSYGFNAKPVLKNLSFEIKGGEKVCIFGTKGSGKSTLLGLFTGGYLNYEGNLLFNGYPLGNYNLQKLRLEIGVYLDNSELFSGTLYDNLTLGDTSIPIPFILETANQTGLLPFIQSLHDGLETKINSHGKKLANNTINKILLTRSLLTKPRLLLLADCWNGLEKIEQENIVNNLTSKHAPFTLVVVSNDENFARKCDKIILLDDGKLIAFGDFETVSKMKEYKKIFKHIIQ
jgi:ATP-binding cassette, subfamily B, bacterial